MTNRRQSKISQAVVPLAVALWQTRRVALLSLPYLLLLAWLFAAGPARDARVQDIRTLPDTPAWSPPSREHWFGTTAAGADLFELSRAAMANSLALAVVAVGFGAALALLAASPFLFREKEGRYVWPERIGSVVRSVPGAVVLVVFSGGAGGGQRLAMAGIAGLVAAHLVPLLCAWFREQEEGFDLVAAKVLGLSRRDIVLSRPLPSALRRLPGAFAALLPQAVLAEMALSYLGFAGDRLSVGSLVGQGQAYLIEAPWLSVHPGLLATAVVLALSFLGWRVSTALGTGPIPRFL